MSAKRTTSAISRNREVIADVLESEMPSSGLVVEIACGPGAHSAYFAQRMPLLEWLPTDVSLDALASARAWVLESECDNLREPQQLDVADVPWGIGEPAAAVVCINMLHISPFPRCAEGLFAGAAGVLSSGAPLLTYGPYIRADVETAPSNIAFDQRLREMDSEWGLRSVEELRALAESHNILLDRVLDMPANNNVLVFRRR